MRKRTMQPPKRPDPMQLSGLIYYTVLYADLPVTGEWIAQECGIAGNGVGTPLVRLVENGWLRDYGTISLPSMVTRNGKEFPLMRPHRLYVANQESKVGVLNELAIRAVEIWMDHIRYASGASNSPHRELIVKILGRAAHDSLLMGSLEEFETNPQMKNLCDVIAVDPDWALGKWITLYGRILEDSEEAA